MRPVYLRLTSGLGLLAVLAGLPAGADAIDDIQLGARQENVRVLGRDSRDEAGSAVAVGDVTGDGIGDIVIGAPLAAGSENKKQTSGEVYVVAGALNLPNTVQARDADRIFYGPEASANLGVSVAVADLNADGVGDLVMAASDADSPGRGAAGAVYVFYGGAGLPTDTTFDLGKDHADIVFYGTQQGERLGVNLAVGDFNGDHRVDLAMAGPRGGATFGRPRAGAVYIFFGRPGLGHGLEVQPSVPFQTVIRGPYPDALAGHALAAGDVNGDGIDDLLIGTVRTQEPLTGSGDIYVVFGSAALPGEFPVDLGDANGFDVKIAGAQAGDKFATAVGAGDINGDGVKDILIGAPGATFMSSITTGLAYAVFGRPFTHGTVVDLATQSADVQLTGSDAGSEFGSSIVTGDFDHDGIADWVIGAPNAVDPQRYGQAFVVPGRRVWSELGVRGSFVRGVRSGDRTGEAVASGDINGDDVTDLVLSSPLYDGTDADRRDAGAVYAILGKSGAGGSSPACSDADADGYRMEGGTCGPADCNDHDAAVHPMADEICGDGIDNNCDGSTDGSGGDADGDGYTAGDSQCGISDCDDADPTVHPGAIEICNDGKDNDCNGLKDDQEPSCRPPGREVCTNCVDDDGDGFGDLADPECRIQMETLYLEGVNAQKVKKKAGTLRQVIATGSLDADLLQDRTQLASDGAIVGLTFENGRQLCVPVKGGRAGKRSMTLRGTDAVLQLRNKHGQPTFAIRYKGSIELPKASPVVFSVGIYAPSASYRGEAELRAKGPRALVN